jgi:hypothetical protein
MQALTTPPYDQISAADQDRYRRASEFNAVRLELGEEAEIRTRGRAPVH